MPTTEIVLLVVAVLVVLLIVAVLLAAVRKRKRSEQLRGTFGGEEYDRTVEGAGKKREAERELAERKQEHETLDIRPLPSATRERYLKAWEGVQTRFVDSPVLALSEADALLTRLLAERGFPTDDVRHSEAMLSVEHGQVLQSFRAGHAIEQANSTQRADTEQVRQGMLHFREVFEQLVSEDATEPYPEQDANGAGSTAEGTPSGEATSVRQPDSTGQEPRRP